MNDRYKFSLQTYLYRISVLIMNQYVCNENGNYR